MPELATRLSKIGRIDLGFMWLQTFKPRVCHCDNNGITRQECSSFARSGKFHCKTVLFVIAVISHQGV